METPGARTGRAFFPYSPWAWALAFASASVILLLAKPYVAGKARPDSFMLTATDRSGRMEVHWDPSLDVVKTAHSAVLDVLDGNDIRRYPVNAKVLRAGALDYLRNADDATVSLILLRDGQTIGQATIQTVAAVNAPTVTRAQAQPAASTGHRARRRLP
jgi:hypothetical protein